MLLIQTNYILWPGDQKDVSSKLESFKEYAEAQVDSQATQITLRLDKLRHEKKSAFGVLRSPYKDAIIHKRYGRRFFIGKGLVESLITRQSQLFIL